MNQTPTYELPIYEPNDPASLIDGYNKAMLKIDTLIRSMQNIINQQNDRLNNLEGKI